MEQKLKHLEMLQAIINRMASNSFLIKGWCVTLVAGLFALGTSTDKPNFVFLAYFPILMFWLLDGYYVWQEKLFRGLYDEVRQKPPNVIDFSMDTTSVRASVPPHREVMLSNTIGLFYITLVIAVLFTWTTTR
ncbi:MAG: hypothetical protein M3R24_28580 [Chloroflexota bacterium]|nr:hypothetical protein [Chloroflexota bacterium]